MEYFIQELMNDNGIILHCIKRNVDLSIILLNCIQKRHVPRVSNFAETVVPAFSTTDFRMHFRIDRATFEIILQTIAPHLTSNYVSGKEQIPPEKQLLLFIWYISNQESMREAANLFGISISTVHGTVLKVCHVFNQTFKNMIQWPDNQRQNEMVHSFQLPHGLPGVCGIIDGTHIQLAGALDEDQDYINRKGYPSVQLQVVVDDNLMVISAQTGWPGCAHDARVLRNSGLFDKAETGMYIPQDRHLLGDSAYPLKPWLITPFRDNGHLTDRQKRFNKIVSSCRQTVERAIGHIKGRFRRLREVTFHNIKDICELVMAGCILHNFCIIHEDCIEDFIEMNPMYYQHPNNYPNIYRNDGGGIAKRNRLLHGLP